ncbi:hypothetical protein [Teredinibacter turnerae]|uniref:hypothetical protein n=1 Tax=Teredinibacter turnerae TaxID=2426 RepID=UPI00037096C2|nr:hypothetical protein [Teredinibacter turnerae]
MNTNKSSLFDLACKKALDKDGQFLKKWSDFEVWLKSADGLTAVWDRDPCELLLNIYCEVNMIPGESFSEFLLSCTAVVAEKCSEDEKRKKFVEMLNDCSLSGEQVAKNQLPKKLYRFVDDFLIKEILKHKGLDHTAEDYRNGHISIDEVMSDIEDCWDENNFPSNCMLHAPWTKSIFATLGEDRLLDSTDPDDIADMLALPVLLMVRHNKERRPFIRIEYPVAKISAIKLPTVTDAGIYTYFSPNRKKFNGVVCGWTKPFSSAFSPKPEVVHSNEPASVISDMPKLFGEVTG